MNWGWPQWVQLILICIALGNDIFQHGETKTEETNFFKTFFIITLSNVILYFGGFWTP